MLQVDTDAKLNVIMLSVMVLNVMAPREEVTYSANDVSSNSIPAIKTGDPRGSELDLGRQQRLP